MLARIRNFAGLGGAYPDRRWHGRSTRSLATLMLGMLGVLAIGVVAGLLSVVVGDFAGYRPVFFAALPLLIVVGFALVISPKALLLAIILLRAGANPLFEGAQFAGVGGLGGLINLAVIMLAFILVAREPKRVPRAAWWAWIPFLGMQIIGLSYSPDLLPSARLALGQISTFAMFVVAFHLVDDLVSLDKLFRLILASSLPVAMLTVLAIARGDVTSTLDGMDTVSGRYGGPFPHPNILAFYLVTVIGVTFYMLKRVNLALGLGARMGLVLYLLLLFGLLYATKTRSAWIAAAFMFLLYGVFVERRYLIYMIIAPALAMFIPEFRDRVLDLGQGNEVVQYARLNSFAWRKLIWADGLAWMDPARYFAGYGAGGFFYNSPTFFSMSGGINWGAHSVVVQLFFDSGIIGLGSYIWLFVGCFRIMRPILRLDVLLGIVFIAALGTYGLVSLSDNMLSYLVYNWYFWLSIGAVCAVASRQLVPQRAGAGADTVGMGR